MTISYRIYFILKVLEYFIYNTLQDKIYKDYKIVIISHIFVQSITTHILIFKRFITFQIILPL